MTKFIAERKLLYSLKGFDDKRDLIIRIGTPYIVKQGMVEFPIGDGLIGCHIETIGLEKEYSHEVYGVDGIQALDNATDIDPFLERLRKKYDLYWPTGEDYFEKYK